MGWFSWLFGSSSDEVNRDRANREQEAERQISPAMPMAEPGAANGAESDRSETEESLKRAAKNDARD